MDGLLDFLKTPEGQGLLSAGVGYLATAQRGTPVNNVGKAGMAGLLGYSNALNRQQQEQENAVQNQVRQMQMQKMQGDMAAAQRKQEQAAAYRDTLPAQDRGVFDLAPDKYLEHLPQFQKQQLVEVADPNEPLRTVKQWMRPGDSQGTLAGVGPMPEILDPRVQAAKRSIAAAGASRVSVNSPYEPQFDKEMAQLDAKSLDKYRSQAEASRQVLNTLDRLEKLGPATYEAGGAQAKKAAANFLAGMGLNVDPAKLANSQEFDSLSTKLVLDQLGGSLGAGVSNADVDFLKNTVPQLGHSREARQQLINFMRAKANDQMGMYDEAHSYAIKNRGLKGFKQVGKNSAMGGGGWSATVVK